MTMTFADLAETLAEATDLEGERLAVTLEDLDWLRKQYAEARRLEGLPGEDEDLINQP